MLASRVGRRWKWDDGCDCYRQGEKLPEDKDKRTYIVLMNKERNVVRHLALRCFSFAGIAGQDV